MGLFTRKSKWDLLLESVVSAASHSPIFPFRNCASSVQVIVSDTPTTI